MKPAVVLRKPTVEEYHALRDHVGWGVPDVGATEVSIEHALFSVCLELDGELIGMGRVVGDGGLYFYIQDIIVVSEHRGKGYSDLIMQEVLKYVDRVARPCAYVALFAAKGVEGLYEKYGFIERPTDRFGAGMFIPLEKLKQHS